MIAESEILEASVLIVDDLEVNVNLLRQMLQAVGYTKVSATTNPLEVRTLHQQNQYDLILLDLQMPTMDGFEVMESLKADHADGFLPVLVITAQPSHKLKALQAGARDFISKPFDITEVKTRIRNMLEVRLLYKKLHAYNQQLELKVQERTADLAASEARYRSLTELASDWYWEQDENGKFAKVSGPVLEMLGLQAAGPGETVDGIQVAGWNQAEREILQARIAARAPFIDYIFSRKSADGSYQKFRVSGEPMFNRASRFVGYRGIGVEITEPK